MRQSVIFGAVFGAAALASAAQAAPIVLTFEGIADLAQVGNYYNGGAGGSFGVSFNPNGIGLINTQNGGHGNFSNSPSGDTVLFYTAGADEPYGTAATLNDANGFTTGFSFFYSDDYRPGTVSVYSGLDETGTVLATFALPVTAPNLPGGFPDTSNDVFLPIGVAFAGTAKSVAFGGDVGQILFDDMTFGSVVPGPAKAPGVPEPAALALLGVALAGLGAIRRR